MKTALIAVACALAAPAFAQSPDAQHERHVIIDGHDFLADAASARTTADAWRQWGDDLRASLGTMFGDHFAAARTVKGAPYSADIATEANQTLADGNVIARKTTGRVYRDSEGRTRQETVVNGEVKSIQIGDPVEGTAVMLLPGSKRAVRMPHLSLHKDAKERKVLRLADKEIRIEDGKVTVDGKEARGKVEITAGGKEIRIENGKVTIDGREFTPGEGGRKVIVKHLEEGETGDGTRREEVRVHVLRSGDGKEAHAFMPPMPPVPPTPPMPPMPPMSAMDALGTLGARLDGALLRSKGTTTSLGVKEFEGVKAEGKSTVRTIPAGDIGNKAPIMVTSESWYSPELQVTVYSRQIDPRYGETIYRLTNIRRAEPSADLFKVPEEYAVRGKRDRG
ncbi:MAG TPA: hypothetical protein VFV55_06820 [Usitatibacteraceae bacterium]|nr:hypothetical protein [Usitatibacteraceae bacterium]